MLTIEQAKDIGINACIDKIGRVLVTANQDNGVSGWGIDKENNQVYCFVGVDNKPYVSHYQQPLVLDSVSQFQYQAKCFVSLTDGTITFLDEKEQPI